MHRLPFILAATLAGFVWTERASAAPDRTIDAATALAVTLAEPRPAADPTEPDPVGRFTATPMPTPDPDEVRLEVSPEKELGVASVVALNAIVGAGVNGVRLEAFPFSAGRFKLGLEVAGGYVASTAGASPGMELGVRAQLRAISSSRDALYVSPGLSGLIQFGNESPTIRHDVGWTGPDTDVTVRACDMDFGAPPCTTVSFASLNLDISWVHEYTAHAAFELGLFGGLGVGLGGTSASRNAAGLVTPRAGLFIGTRL